MVILPPQHGENAAFLSSFPVVGIHSWGILLVIPLGLQGKKHRPFFMVQPKIKYQPFPIVQPRIKAEGPVRGRGCFISTVQWEHTVFSSLVPFMDFMAEAFCWLFLWASRKKASTIFYGIAKNKASTVSYRTAKDKSGRPCQRVWLFHLHSMMRTYYFFFSCSVYGLYGWGILLLILLGLKKAVS